MAELDYHRHLLDEHTNQEIFLNEIVPTEIHGQAEPVTQPTALFVAGQPGSGKTALTAAIVATLADQGGCVVINSDSYKPFHPRWEELLQQDTATAGPYTAADGRRWMTRTEDHCASQALNIVIETTMRDPGVYTEPVERLRRQGYRIETAVVATPAAASRLAILARFAEQLQRTGYGRLTEPTNHDACYQTVAQQLDAEDQHPTTDVITIWRRDGTLLYANETTNRTWADPPRAALTLTRERTRPWSETEYQQWSAEIRNLREHLPESLLPQLLELLETSTR